MVSAWCSRTEIPRDTVKQSFESRNGSWPFQILEKNRQGLESWSIQARNNLLVDGTSQVLKPKGWPLLNLNPRRNLPKCWCPTSRGSPAPRPHKHVLSQWKIINPKHSSNHLFSPHLDLLTNILPLLLFLFEMRRWGANNRSWYCPKGEKIFTYLRKYFSPSIYLCVCETYACIPINWCQRSIGVVRGRQKPSIF